MKHKHISFLLVFLLLYGCNNINPEGDADFNEKEIRLNKKKDYVKDGSKYLGSNNYDEKTKIKLSYYNSLEKSVAMMGSDQTYGYKGQKIDKILHIFRYENGVINIIFISRLHDSSKLGYFDQVIHTKNENSKIKYSNVISSIKERELFNEMPIESYANKIEFILNRQQTIGLPVENDLNGHYGFTTDDKVKSLKIESQKPDGIKEFKANGIKYYFWYYENIKSNKEVDKYTVEYEGYSNIKKY